MGTMSTPSYVNFFAKQAEAHYVYPFISNIAIFIVILQLIYLSPFGTSTEKRNAPKQQLTKDTKNLKSEDTKITFQIIVLQKSKTSIEKLFSERRKMWHTQTSTTRPQF